VYDPVHRLYTTRIVYYKTRQYIIKYTGTNAIL